MHRLYETDEISVFWNSDKCQHATECRKGSPKTFDVNRRPWIDLTKAPTAEIWQAVSKCPSKALTCTYNHNVRIVFDEENHRCDAFRAGEHMGACQYSVDADAWIIYHTEVSEELRGKNIAKRLVYRIVGEAERRNVTLLATCTYAAKILKEN